MLCTVLAAGLWPFHTPENGVSWLQNQSGLRFGRYGTAYSHQVFHGVRAQDLRCSLELWLQPDSVDNEGTIISFDSSAEPSWPFALRQHRQVLAVRRYTTDQKGVARRPGLWLDGVFNSTSPMFVALTSNAHQTTVYVNGSPIEESSSLGFACKDLIGQLILANSTIDDSWSGQILQLAIYDGPLTSMQILEHYKVPTLRQERGQKEEGLAALYPFDERFGTVVHNRIGSGADIDIPQRYLVLHPGFLTPLWNQQSYYATRPWVRGGFWKDIAVNVGGFVPLGFLFLAYFSMIKQTPRATITVVFLGFAISLTIEVAQRFLPTRDSGMLDLVTNTLGTYLGVVLFGFVSRVVPARYFDSV